MILKNISIKGLFETFDHYIPLFQREPITIIHGPNGVGKTSILRLVYGILKPVYGELRRIPFSELTLTFDDGTTLLTRPVQGEETGSRVASRTKVIYQLIRDGSVEQEFQDFGKPPARQSLRHLDRWLPFLSQVGPDDWFDPHSESVLGAEQVIQLYASQLPEGLWHLEIPSWLRDIQQNTAIHFIETQRLLRTGSSGVSTHSRVPVQQSSVKKCASELADRIKSTLAESATLSQGLERSFPARLIQEGPVTLGEDDIRARLSQLEQRRSRLAEGGLLDASGFEPALPAKRFDDTTQRVLAVYIRDTEQKLAVFGDLLSRIELIKSIVDSRFLQKSVNVNREAGFVVKTRDGRNLDLSGLSSGEQHELVLLYELLFRAEPNTLILIDEPELSLHIAWQQQFLRDLLQITKLAKLQVLIATHSPQIIHDRWDLTVELLGPSR